MWSTMQTVSSITRWVQILDLTYLIGQKALNGRRLSGAAVDDEVEPIASVVGVRVLLLGFVDVFAIRCTVYYCGL